MTLSNFTPLDWTLSSLTIHIEVWATSPLSEATHKVTEGIFVFVALDDQGRPAPIDHPS